MTRPPHRGPAASPAAEAIRRTEASDPAIPVSELAARHHASKKTVIRALTPPSPEHGPPPPWPGPSPAQLAGIFDEWLALQPALTASEAWQRLTDQHDAEFTYTHFATYLRRRRHKINDKKAPEPPARPASQSRPD